MSAIYRLLMLSDENDNFLREYDLAADCELADLHGFICSDLKFDANVMASFFAASPMWEKQREYTLFDFGDGHGDIPAEPMNGVKISELVSQPRDRMIFLFDIFSDRALFIELVEVLAPETGVEYPRCALMRGEAPDQFEPSVGDSEGSVFDDVMSDFGDFEGDDSYDDD